MLGLVFLALRYTSMKAEVYGDNSNIKTVFVAKNVCIRGRGSERGW